MPLESSRTHVNARGRLLGHARRKRALNGLSAPSATNPQVHRLFHMIFMRLMMGSRPYPRANRCPIRPGVKSHPIFSSFTSGFAGADRHGAGIIAFFLGL